MKLRVFSLTAVVAFALTGCSGFSEEEHAKAEACIRRIDDALKTIESLGYSEASKSPTTYEEARLKARALQHWHLEGVKRTLNERDANPKAARRHFGFAETCSVSAIDIDNKEYLRNTGWEDKRQEEQAREIANMNRAIDRAQDELLSDYSRKAKRHTVPGGPGPRIDTFEMHDGTIVICSTTVQGGGRATSCR